MKILVTGGAGFIGSHLVDKLIAKKHRVVVIDNLSCGKKKFINKKAKFYCLDVKSPKLKDVFAKEKPEIVFHLAAQKSVPFSLRNPLDDASVNIWGSLRVIEQSLKTGVKKFIFISTGGAIYGQSKEIPATEKAPEIPDSPYALAKLTIDNYLKNYYSRVKKMKFVSLRLANVYGPRQDPEGEAGVIAIFISRLLKKKTCYINGSGRQTRDFVFVDDVVDACIKSLRKGSGIYNVGSGKETSVNTLYHLIVGLISESKPKRRPAIEGEVIRSVLSSKLIKKDLAWQPKTNLIKGIKKTIEYFKHS